MRIESMNIENFKAYSRNVRVHRPKQVEEIAPSIKVFGFTNPILVDQNNMILPGHGRVMAVGDGGSPGDKNRAFE